MKLLWISYSFEIRGGELFTATYKIELRRWEIMSNKRYLDPVVFTDFLDNATRNRAWDLIQTL
jgi:hypothetical protein